jgi:hypothetical protein
MVFNVIVTLTHINPSRGNEAIPSLDTYSHELLIVSILINFAGRVCDMVWDGKDSREVCSTRKSFLGLNPHSI